MEIIQSYTLYFNTRQRNSGTIDNATFILPTPIVLKNVNNRFIISAPLIEIPYSFDQINTLNNILYYSFTDGTGTVNSSITIPTGNYNINNLLTTITNLLYLDYKIYRPASLLLQTNISMNYNQSTGRVTYYITFGSALSFTFKLANDTIFYIMLGLLQSNTNTFGTAVTLISPNKVQVNPVTALYLRSNNLKFTSNYEAILEKCYVGSDIITKIQCNFLPNSILYYRSDTREMINNTNITDINLYLSDNITSNYSINMNGVDWACMLQIEEVQIKPNNAYNDKIGEGKLQIPQEYLGLNDRLLDDLITQKVKLEDDLKKKKEDIITDLQNKKI